MVLNYHGPKTVPVLGSLSQRICPTGTSRADPSSRRTKFAPRRSSKPSDSRISPLPTERPSATRLPSSPSRAASLAAPIARFERQAATVPTAATVRRTAPAGFTSESYTQNHRDSSSHSTTSALRSTSTEATVITFSVPQRFCRRAVTALAVGARIGT